MVNLSNRTCLVTGATSGHGEAVAKALARMGADMILLGRNREKCERVQREIQGETSYRPDILICDLASQEHIRRAAAEFLSWKRPLHILINNAGLVNQHFQESADGYEETFAVNYLAMFHLTLLLIDRMIESAPARIVNVASDTHINAHLNLDDIEGRNRRYSFMGAYGRSKLAVVYFTRELAKRLEGTTVTVNAVDPGPIASGITRKPGILAKIVNAILQVTFPKPERAAQTAVYLASSPDLMGENGGYWRYMKKKDPTVSGDPAFSPRIWEISKRMAGVEWDR